MIDYPTFCQLRMLLDEKHLTTAQVAVELKLDPKTVAHWADRTSYQQRQRSKRPSKLDAFKGQIVALLERHAYSAQQLLQQLKPLGYAGGYSIVKDYVRLIRPPHKPAFLTLEFAPGECAQVDWGQLRRGQRWSHQTPPELLCHGPLPQPHPVCPVHALRGHGALPCLPPAAFAFFGGVPAKCMIDNLKSAVLDIPWALRPVLIPVTWTSPTITALSPWPASPRPTKGTRGKCRGLCQKKLSGRPGTPLLCGGQPGRPGVDGDRGQRAHPRRAPAPTPVELFAQ